MDGRLLHRQKSAGRGQLPTSGWASHGLALRSNNHVLLNLPGICDQGIMYWNQCLCIEGHSQHNSAHSAPTYLKTFPVVFPVSLIKMTKTIYCTFNFFNTNLIKSFTNNFVPLINMICARKKDLFRDHFRHDASNRPNIHLLSVSHA